MKKKLTISLALVGALLSICACQKEELKFEHTNGDIPPISLQLEAPSPITAPATTRWAVEHADPTNPRKLNITWNPEDASRIEVYLFQAEDNKDWKKGAWKQLYAYISSKAVKENGILDTKELIWEQLYSSKEDLDPNKPAKYVITAGNFRFWNSPTISYPQALGGKTGQISTAMPAWTRVLTAKPMNETGGKWLLNGKLEWAAAVLAVKFDVDSKFKDMTFTFRGFSLDFTISKGKDFPMTLDPVLRTPAPLKYMTAKDHFKMSLMKAKGKKISELVREEDMGYHYFSIPAEMENSTIDLDEAEFRWGCDLKFGEKSFKKDTVIGKFKKGTKIFPGKCYSMTIEVKDAGDGTPIFVKK